MNSSISWYVASVASENFICEIVCSGLKNKDFIRIKIHQIISNAKNNHRDKIFLNFWLILISGIGTPDLFRVFLIDCLRFLRENGLWLTNP